MTERRLIPVDGKTLDWPRQVANASNNHELRIRSNEDSIATLQTATDWSALGNYADDAAAASGGVAVGELYRNGSVVQVRVS